MSRDFADIMPLVTELPRPKGLPMAKIHSPTLMLSELPNFTALSGSKGEIFRRDKSVLLSIPIISAG